MSELIAEALKYSICICEDVSIGKDVTIGHNVLVSKDTTIGGNTVIHNGTDIGESTTIGTGCKIDHDVAICDNTVIGSYVGIMSNTFIGNHVNVGDGITIIGKNVTISDHVTIGTGVILDDNVKILPGVSIPADIHVSDNSGNAVVKEEVSASNGHLHYLSTQVIRDTIAIYKDYQDKFNNSKTYEELIDLTKDIALELKHIVPSIDTDQPLLFPEDVEHTFKGVSEWLAMMIPSSIQMLEEHLESRD